MRKRIELVSLPIADFASTRVPTVWKATSRRFGVSAYGRTVSEAKQRLFITSQVQRSNQVATIIAHERRIGKTKLYWRNGMLVGHTGQTITSADVREVM